MQEKTEEFSLGFLLPLNHRADVLGQRLDGIETGA